jgi:hypothetical protein
MGLGSEIRDPEKNLFRIPDPGQKSTGSRIRIRNTDCLTVEVGINHHTEILYIKYHHPIILMLR